MSYFLGTLTTVVTQNLTHLRSTSIDMRNMRTMLTVFVRCILISALMRSAILYGNRLNTGTGPHNFIGSIIREQELEWVESG